MTPGARVAAAIEILDRIQGGAAAEQALTSWARASRFAGSKDRAAIRDHVFDVLRAKRSLGDGTGRQLMAQLALREGWDTAALFSGEGHAPAALGADELSRYVPQSPDEAADMPTWLWPSWQASLGEAATKVAQVQQARADVFLRVNTRRCGLSDAVSALAEDGVSALPHSSLSTCLRVTENARRVKTSKAYKEGLVELQDAASQWAVAQVPVVSGARVLDYCAGGGGKALAFADLYQARVAAHDIAPQRMSDLPARAARAGLQIDILPTSALAQNGPFDVVFCDAPCSGSGTWRRTPDAKWRFSASDLERLIQSQIDVLTSAAPLVAPGGTLVYATCSVLACENGDIIQKFTAQFSEWHVERQEQRYPNKDGDGFFLAVLDRP